jgi:hypothetical protein
MLSASCASRRPHTHRSVGPAAPDGILSWVPGANVAYSVGAGALLMFEAVKAQAETGTLVRMALYLAANTALDGVPVVGGRWTLCSAATPWRRTRCRRTSNCATACQRGRHSVAAGADAPRRQPARGQANGGRAGSKPVYPRQAARGLTGAVVSAAAVDRTVFSGGRRESRTPSSSPAPLPRRRARPRGMCWAL